MELEAQAHGRLELEDADTASTTAVPNERRRLNEVRDRLTRLQIERGVITKADATALRKVAWPHILQQHCTCEDDGLCEYLRAKYNAEDSREQLGADPFTDNEGTEATEEAVVATKLARPGWRGAAPTRSQLNKRFKKQLMGEHKLCDE